MELESDKGRQDEHCSDSALVSACCVCCSHNIGGVLFPPLSAVPGRRQNTIVVKVPGQEDSHNEDGESGSEASDSVSTCGQSGSQNIGNNVTLITLNSEGARTKSFLCLSGSSCNFFPRF